jgi:ribosome-associated protein
LKREARLDTVTIARAIVDALEDKKAENILLLDLQPTGLTGQKAEHGDYTITDYFVIATGNSDRQIRALADHVREAIKILYEKSPAAVDGEAASGWVLMDYGDIIVHIMSEEMRAYYDLEGLYRQANILLRIQ